MPYCKHCKEYISTNSKTHNCKKKGFLDANNDDSFLLEIIDEATSDSGFLGDILDDLFD